MDWIHSLDSNVSQWQFTNTHEHRFILNISSSISFFKIRELVTFHTQYSGTAERDRRAVIHFIHEIHTISVWIIKPLWYPDTRPQREKQKLNPLNSSSQTATIPQKFKTEQRNQNFSVTEPVLELSNQGNCKTLHGNESYDMFQETKLLFE